MPAIENSIHHPRTRKENNVFFRFFILVIVSAMTLGMASAQNAGPMVMDMREMKNVPGPTSRATQAYMWAMKAMQVKMKSFAPTNDPDKDFVIMMKPHHKAAIDMARAYLKYGTDPILRKMAQGMVRDQGKEYEEMSAWEVHHGVKN
jgi:uncharacterized protein (DUF305 family)